MRFEDQNREEWLVGYWPSGLDYIVFIILLRLNLAKGALKYGNPMPHWIKELISATSPIQIPLTLCRQKGMTMERMEFLLWIRSFFFFKHGGCLKFLVSLWPSRQDMPWRCFHSKTLAPLISIIERRTKDYLPQKKGVLFGRPQDATLYNVAFAV